jgi:hypothetical protein
LYLQVLPLPLVNSEIEKPSEVYGYLILRAWIAYEGTLMVLMIDAFLIVLTVGVRGGLSIEVVRGVDL